MRSQVETRLIKFLILFICLGLSVMNLHGSNSTHIENLEFQNKNEAASLALWLMIVLIFVPFMLVIVTFLICCNYVCYWCQPRGYHEHDIRPALIVDRGNNFNAL